MNIEGIIIKVVKSFSISIEVAQYLENRKKDESAFIMSAFLEDLIKAEMLKEISEVKTNEQPI